MVETSALVKSSGMGGAHPKLWGYGYADIAAVAGCSEGAVRMAVYDKKLDPASLQSVAEFINARRGRCRKSG